MVYDGLVFKLTSAWVGRACLVGSNFVATSPPFLTSSQPLPGALRPSYPHRTVLWPHRQILPSDSAPAAHFTARYSTWRLQTLSNPILQTSTVCLHIRTGSLNPTVPPQVQAISQPNQKTGYRTSHSGVRSEKNKSTAARMTASMPSLSRASRTRCLGMNIMMRTSTADRDSYH